MPGPFDFPPPPSFKITVPQPLYSFWDMLDEAFLSEKLPRFKPDNHFYPSQASVELQTPHGAKIEGECLRKLYWFKKGEPFSNPTPPPALWKMELGNKVSELIVEQAKKRGVYVADEVPFVDEENKISGRVDLMYRHPVTQEIVGVEIKSVGGYQALKGVITGPYGTVLKPKIPHQLQTLIYLDFFNKNMGVNLFEVAYIARCTGERNVFRCTLTDDRELLIDGMPTGLKPDGIYGRFRKLQGYLEKEQLPPRDYEISYSREKIKSLARSGSLTKKQRETVSAGKKVVKGDYSCQICPFKDRCWESS
jgi:hypothetical protein